MTGQKPEHCPSDSEAESCYTIVGRKLSRNLALGENVMSENRTIIAKINLWEHIFRGAIGSEVCNLHQILIGLHNAMTHGDILGENCSDKELIEFYEKLDAVVACELVQNSR
jgi:hypothetical protein